MVLFKKMGWSFRMIYIVGTHPSLSTNQRASDILTHSKKKNKFVDKI